MLWPLLRLRCLSDAIVSLNHDGAIHIDVSKDNLLGDPHLFDTFVIVKVWCNWLVTQVMNHYRQFKIYDLTIWPGMYVVDAEGGTVAEWLERSPLSLRVLGSNTVWAPILMLPLYSCCVSFPSLDPKQHDLELQSLRNVNRSILFTARPLS